MMDRVVDITGAREDETTMAQPSRNPTVDDYAQRDDRMASEGESHDAGSVVDSRLNRVHACSREAGRVVAHVVQ